METEILPTTPKISLFIADQHVQFLLKDYILKFEGLLKVSLDIALCQCMRPTCRHALACALEFSRNAQSWQCCHLCIAS